MDIVLGSSRVTELTELNSMSLCTHLPPPCLPLIGQIQALRYCSSTMSACPYGKKRQLTTVFCQGYCLILVNPVFRRQARGLLKTSLGYIQSSIPVWATYRVLPCSKQKQCGSGLSVQTVLMNPQPF